MEKNILKNKQSFIDKLSLVGSSDERNLITENLSIMIGAGLAIPFALESIIKSLRNKTLIKILKGVVSDLDEGSSLYLALKKTTLLPPYALSLIEIGEQSGRLNQNLQAVAMQQQKEDALNSKLRSAMIYPVLVLSITVIVGLGVAWFILPRLSRIFLNLKLKLPLVTRVLISFADLLSHQGYWLVPFMIVVLFLFIYFIFYNRKTNRIGQSILFFVPVTRRLIVNSELSRMGFIMSSLLSAGIPIHNTVRLLEESSLVYRYKNFYHYLGEGFDVGNSFKTSFEKYPKIDNLIPPSIQQVIISGEQSGKLSDSLLLVANRFEQKTDESIKNLPVILEPLFLVIVWVGVLLVALAVIMPIYTLVGNLNNSASSPEVHK